MVSLGQVADVLMQELPLDVAVRVILRLSSESGNVLSERMVDSLGLVSEYSHPTDVSDLVSYRPTELSEVVG